MHPLQLEQDQWVWYAPPGSDVYSAFRITGIDSDFTMELLDMKKNSISVPYSVLENDTNCICPLKDPAGDLGKYTAPDLRNLNRIDLTDIECCIRNQFSCGLIYTNIGNNVTLHMNPNRPMDIYNDAFVDRYSELDPELPPHIFSFAANAYKSLVQDGLSQVIVSLGDAGSGKSASIAHVLHFVAKICVMDEAYGQKCQAVPIVLDAFLSAVLDVPIEGAANIAAKDCWSSSRAVTSLHLDFDSDGFIATSTASVHFYERSRIATPENGRNFNVFYLYMALADLDNDRQGFDWIGEEREFRIAPYGERNLDKMDAANAQEFVAALELLGIETASVFRALGAMLMLSNTVVSEDELTGEVLIDMEDGQCAALETDAATLRALLQQESAEATLNAINRFITDMYDVLLTQIVNRINEQLFGDDDVVSSMILVNLPAPDAGKRTDAFDSLVFHWISDKMTSMQVDSVCPSGVNLDELAARTAAFESLEVIDAFVADAATKIELGTSMADEAIAIALSTVPVEHRMQASKLTLNHGRGPMTYPMDSTFAYYARAGWSTEALLAVLENSGCELLESGDERRHRGLEEVELCIGFLESLFSGETGVRLVLNFRANQRRSKTELDRILLLEQLQFFGIEAIVNFNRSRHAFAKDETSNPPEIDTLAHPETIGKRSSAASGNVVEYIVWSSAASGNNPESVGKRSSAVSGNDRESIGERSSAASGNNPEIIGRRSSAASGNYPETIGKRSIAASGNNPGSIGQQPSSVSGNYPEAVAKRPSGASRNYPESIGERSSAASRNNPKSIEQRPSSVSGDYSEAVEKRPSGASRNYPESIGERSSAALRNNPESIGEWPSSASRNNPEAVAKRSSGASGNNPEAVAKRPSAASGNNPEAVAKRPSAASGNNPEAVEKRPSAASGNNPEAVEKRPSAASGNYPEAVAKRPSAASGNNPESIGRRPGSVSGNNAEAVGKRLRDSAQSATLLTNSSTKLREKTPTVEARLTVAIQYLQSIRNVANSTVVAAEVSALEDLISNIYTAMEQKDDGEVQQLLEASELRLELLQNFQEGAFTKEYLGGQRALHIAEEGIISNRTDLTWATSLQKEIKEKSDGEPTGIKQAVVRSHSSRGTINSKSHVPKAPHFSQLKSICHSLQEVSSQLQNPARPLSHSLKRELAKMIIEEHNLVVHQELQIFDTTSESQCESIEAYRTLLVQLQHLLNADDARILEVKRRSDNCAALGTTLETILHPDVYARFAASCAKRKHLLEQHAKLIGTRVPYLAAKQLDYLDLALLDLVDPSYALPPNAMIPSKIVQRKANDIGKSSNEISGKVAAQKIGVNALPNSPDATASPRAALLMGRARSLTQFQTPAAKRAVRHLVNCHDGYHDAKPYM